MAVGCLKTAAMVGSQLVGSSEYRLFPLSQRLNAPFLRSVRLANVQLYILYVELFFANVLYVVLFYANVLYGRRPIGSLFIS